MLGLFFESTHPPTQKNVDTLLPRFVHFPSPRDLTVLMRISRKSSSCFDIRISIDVYDWRPYRVTLLDDELLVCLVGCNPDQSANQIAYPYLYAYEYSCEMDAYQQCGALLFDPERMLEKAQQPQSKSTSQHQTAKEISSVDASCLSRVHLFASTKSNCQLLAVILQYSDVCCTRVDIR